ncbi:MAG: hypothetical protein ABI867_09870 [Kofleriaceae bacterium]
MRAIPAVVIALVSLLSLRAEADVSKAWAAASANLPAETRAIGAIDVAVAVKSPSFAQVFELLQKEEKDIRMAYELVKTNCKIDPVQVVEGVVIAGTPDHGRGAVYIQLSIDRAKAISCVESIFAANKMPKPKISVDGNMTVISVGKEAMYVAWVTKDVVAIAFKDPTKKSELAGWTGGKGALAKTALAAQIGKTDTKAAAWGAFALDKPLDDNDMKVTSGWGVVNYVKANLAGSVHGNFVDAAAAAKTYAKMQQELAKEMGRKNTPAAMLKVMKAMKLSSKASEVVLEASVSEADLLAAFLAAIH